MSKRLDISRQQELEPERMAHAIAEIEKLGYVVYDVEQSNFKFLYKDEVVIMFAYSGWHTGKSIKDGRGLQKLLNQLKP